MSARLQQVPAWVVDYVLVHELAHLLEAGHTPEFWAWVERYPRAEKAKGYLEGYSAAARLEPPPGMVEDEPDQRRTRSTAASMSRSMSSYIGGSASTGHHFTSSDSSLTW